MSSCQGELNGQPFEVTATTPNGQVLFDGEVTTLRNGFFELWLPRDRLVELSISGAGGVAKGLIGTYEKSKTCVTTFQLQ